MIPAIILAGGLGTRLKSAVSDVPKPMAPIENRPFLEYQLDFWIAKGLTEFTLSVGYLSEVISKHFGSSYRDARLTYSNEPTPLGTGGGVVRAIKMMEYNGSILLLNGDTFFNVDINDLLSFHNNNSADITIALSSVQKNTRFGAVTMNSHCEILALDSFGEGRSELINGGVYILESGAIRDLALHFGNKFSFETEMLPLALERQLRMFGYLSNGAFIDIGTPEDYARAAAFLAE